MESSLTPLYTVVSLGLPGCGLKTELENRLRIELGVCFVSSKFLGANIVNWGSFVKRSFIIHMIQPHYI